jgi:hypothetical protein
MAHLLLAEASKGKIETFARTREKATFYFYLASNL